MAESIITNALNSEHMPEIHIVPVVEEDATDEKERIVTKWRKEFKEASVVKHKDTIIPYDNSNETKALRAAAKTMGIKRLKWIVKEINGVKVRTIDRRTFNGRGRNRRNTTVSKILQS